MSKLDRMLLALTTQKNPMLIFGMIIVDGVLKFEGLQSALEKLVQEQPRLRAYYEDHEYKVLDSFDLKSHVHFLDGPTRDQRLEEYISARASCHFNPKEPQWDMILFESDKNFEYIDENETRKSPTNTFIIFRIHHCIGDGMSLFYLLERFVELSKRSKAAQIGVTETSRLVILRRMDIPLHRLLFWPIWALAVVPRLICMGKDRNSFIKPKLDIVSNGTKNICWCKPFLVSKIKQISATHGSDSVTSVLLAICSGAIRNVVTQKGEALHDDLKAIVPFSLRGRYQTNLENRVSSLFIRLPTSEKSAENRLKKCCSRMYNLKTGPHALVAVILMTIAVWFLPDWLLRRLQEHYASKCSLVFSCVPGPDEQREILDQPVRSVLGFAPTLGDLSLSIASFEYAGHLRIGIMISNKLDESEQVTKLVENFHSEYELLYKLSTGHEDSPWVSSVEEMGDESDDAGASKVAWGA
eukprot:g826.t1